MHELVIVEHSKAIGIFLCNRLAAIGYTVHHIFTNSRDLLEYVRHNTPDLILMDIQLRDEIDGVTAAEEVRRIRDIPVVFITTDAAQFHNVKTANPYGFLLVDSDPLIMHSVIEIALQRVHLERQLLQSQKMESIGTLTAGIAHEINSPLQFIGDNLQFVNDSTMQLLKFCLDIRTFLAKNQYGECQHLTTETQSDLDYFIAEIPLAIKQSQEGLERVNRIVRAMKDFSYHHTETKQLVNLNEAIENTITISRNEWKYVAELTEDLDPHLPLVACCVDEIKQVLLNLIINAAHAIKEKKQDSSEMGRLTITSRFIENHVIITIGDTGIGISDSIKAKVYDPFFTTKPVGVGTGQGLAISYAIIVRNHNGHIAFESEPGKGTTFTIRLPLGLLNDTPE